MAEFKELEGKTLSKVDVIDNDIEKDDEIVFTCSDGSIYNVSFSRLL